MFVKLFFQRHGVADWPDWSGADSERPLTPDGKKRMQAQAAMLAGLDVNVDVLLTSPLVRARQTAELLAGKLKADLVTDPSLGPGFNIARLKHILKRYPDANALMLVGHEPDFSTTVSALVGGGRLQLKKGGLARVDVDSTDPLSGQLIWLAPPKLLAGE